MGKNNQIFKVQWKDEYQFLSEGPSVYKAKCNDCNSVFSIKSGGRADIKQHCKSD